MEMNEFPIVAAIAKGSEFLIDRYRNKKGELKKVCIVSK